MFKATVAATEVANAPERPAWRKHSFFRRFAKVAP
jgi:hypothetical protein